MNNRKIFLIIYGILYLILEINIVKGYQYKKFNEKYYNLFGDKIFQGSPIFLLDEKYNDFNDSIENTSYLYKSDNIFDMRGKKITFKLENTAYRILLDIGYGLKSYFTPLTLNKIYDGVRGEEEIINIGLKSEFFLTRETANELYSRDFTSEVKERDLSLGIHIMKEINKYNKIGVTYINKHSSEGEVPNTELGIIGSSIEVPPPSIYVRVRNPYSSLNASVREIKVYINGILVDDINVVSDKTVAELNVGRDSEYIYVSGNDEGYAIYRISSSIPINNISSMKFEIIGVKRDYLFEISANTIDYYKIIDVIDVKGTSGNDTPDIYSLTKELSSDIINSLKEDSKNQKGELLMSQILGVDFDFNIFDTSINGEYAMNIYNYGLYKEGKGNKERNEYYNAYYLKVSRGFLDNRFKIGGEYFYIDKNFSDSTFVMDDDDKDGLPDDVQTTIYPYIMPLPGADKNYNGLVDWNEWLTLSNPEPCFRVGRDINNNFILDCFENDDKIDLPYSQDRKGFSIFANYKTSSEKENIRLEYHKRSKITNQQKTENINVIFKGNYNVGENVHFSINNNYKYIIRDNITNNVIGLIDGADNDKDGFIDFDSELTNNYKDTLKKDDIHYNSFSFKSSINIIDNLVFEYNFVYKNKILSVNNIKRSIAKEVNLKYEYKLFENISLIPIMKIATFLIDPNVDTVNFKREGIIKTFLFATTTELVGGARLNTGVEYTYYKDYKNYIEFNRYLGKIEFYYVMRNFYFLGMGYNYYKYDYLGAFKENDREFEQLYVQIRWRR